MMMITHGRYFLIQSNTKILRWVRGGGQPAQGREDGHKAVRGVSEAEVISRHIISVLLDE